VGGTRFFACTAVRYVGADRSRSYKNCARRGEGIISSLTQQPCLGLTSWTPWRCRVHRLNFRASFWSRRGEQHVLPREIRTLAGAPRQGHEIRPRYQDIPVFCTFIWGRQNEKGFKRRGYPQKITPGPTPIKRKYLFFRPERWASRSRPGNQIRPRRTGLRHGPRYRILIRIRPRSKGGLPERRRTTRAFSWLQHRPSVRPRPVRSSGAWRQRRPSVRPRPVRSSGAWRQHRPSDETGYRAGNCLETNTRLANVWKRGGGMLSLRGAARHEANGS